MFDESKTWKENILRVMGKRKWFTHGMIFRALGFDIKKDLKKIKQIGSYLDQLTRSGHVQRAHAPEVVRIHVSKDPNKYVYRGTGRPYNVRFIDKPRQGNRTPKKLIPRGERFEAFQQHVAFERFKRELKDYEDQRNKINKRQKIEEPLDQS